MAKGKAVKGKVGKALARHHRQMPEGSPGEEAAETPAMEAAEQAAGTEIPGQAGMAQPGMARGGRVKGKGGGEHNPGDMRMHQTYARTGTPPGMAKGGKVMAKGGKC